MQTILGSGGAIGKELARELTKYTDTIRLVSRHPSKVNPTDQLFPADITDKEQLDKAVEGSEVVYLIVGFEYNIKVWRQNWPSLMRNVIESCKRHRARLVFFDNVYMYDRDSLFPMTEDTPVNPSSKKGEIRAEIAGMLTKEFGKGELTALIARSADFLSLKNSVVVELVFKNLMKGKKANWLATANKIHNFTFFADAAKATALLGNTPDAFNQVWHLPSIHEKLTGKQWIELVAKELGIQPRLQVMPVWLMGLLGLFVPIMRELKEMVYQQDRDYFFDSSKFEKQFNYQPVTAEEAVKQIHELLK